MNVTIHIRFCQCEIGNQDANQYDPKTILGHLHAKSFGGWTTSKQYLSRYQAILLAKQQENQIKCQKDPNGGT